MSRSSETPSAETLRQRLYDIMDDRSRSTRDKQETVLRIGCQYLGVDSGHIQRQRDDGTDEIVRSVGESGLLPEGTRLDRATTYCRRTVDASAPIALSDAPAQGWADDPAYREHGLDCYLGTTISVNGDLYGTVCFMSRDARSAEFSAEEKLFVEVVARLLGRDLEATTHEATLAETADAKQRTEKTYQALLEAAPDAILLVDADTGLIVGANHETVDLTGYPEAELEGMPVLDLHPDTERERYERILREAAEMTAKGRFEDGTPIEIERADGTRVPIELSTSLVEHDGDRLLQGIMRDVSDRREREQALERQQTLLKQTQRTAQVGGWAFDLRSESLEWTEEVYRIHGLPLEYEPTVEEAIEFYHPEDRPTIEAAFDRLVAEGEPYDLELRLLTPEDDVTWVRAIGEPQYEDGEIVSLRGVFQDITARKGREEQLRIKDRALEEAPVGITIADATSEDMPLVYANPAFEEITQYDRETAVGENCRFLQGPDTDDAAVARIREHLAAEAPSRTQLLNYRADGTPFWNELRLAPITGDETDEVTHFVGIQRDITDRKRRDRSLEVLDRVYRHNLRNAMSVISGYAAAIRHDDECEPAEVAARISAAADEVTAITDKARVLEQAMRETRAPQRRDIVADVEAVVASLRAEYPERTFEISGPTSLEIVATPQVRTVLRELGENAAKHTDGAVTVAVEETADGSAQVEVIDTGPGLAAHEAEVLECGREQALEHGDGLGLWLVNWLVTDVDGEVATSVSDGTTVCLEFPLAPDGEDVDLAAKYRPSALSTLGDMEYS